MESGITSFGITEHMQMFVTVYPPNVTVDGNRVAVFDNLLVGVVQALSMALKYPHRVVTLTSDDGLTFARIFLPHPIVGRNDDGSLRYH